MERRTYRLRLDDLVFVGRPSVAVLTGATRVAEPQAPAYAVATRRLPSPLWVEPPTADEVSDNYLKIRLADGGKVTGAALASQHKLHERWTTPRRRSRRSTMPTLPGRAS